MYTMVLVFLLLLPTTMGLSPLPPHCHHVHQPHLQHQHSREPTRKEILSTLVATTFLLGTTIPSPACAYLTSADLEAVHTVVTASEKRTDLQLKEQDLKLKEMQLQINEKNIMFMLIPSITTGFSTAVATYVTTESNKKFDEAIERFKEDKENFKKDLQADKENFKKDLQADKENFKKDLQAGTTVKAAVGTIVGMVVAVVLMMSGSFHQHS